MGKENPVTENAQRDPVMAEAPEAPFAECPECETAMVVQCPVCFHRPVPVEGTGTSEDASTGFKRDNPTTAKPVEVTGDAFVTPLADRDSEESALLGDCHNASSDQRCTRCGMLGSQVTYEDEHGPHHAPCMPGWSHRWESLSVSKSKKEGE